MQTAKKMAGPPGSAPVEAPRAKPRTTRGLAARWLVPGVLYVLLLAGFVVTTVPYYRMIVASLMPLSEAIKVPPVWIPAAPSLNNYVEVLTKQSFARYFLNSAIVTGASLVLTLATSALAGYTFAKFRFPGQQIMFVIVLATMMMPFQVRMVPLFLMYVSFDWLNTYFGLIIPHVFSPFGIFLMRQYMHTIPGDLIEAARIDGCSEFGIFWRIIVPLSRPALAALTIFSFNNTWDEYLWPLIIVSTSEMRTLPLGLARFAEMYITQTHLQMAGSVLTTLPMVVVFFLLQKEFVRGIALSGIKG